nr:gas vesicle protein GvpJ [Haloarchaeobius amylolyticus]
MLAEGVLVQADVLVSVADIPLVGIELRAAVAGLATMREYGLLADWDREVRREAERAGRD